MTVSLQVLFRFSVTRWLSFFSAIEGLVRLRKAVLAALTEMDQIALPRPVILFLTDFGKLYNVLVSRMQTVTRPIIHKVGDWHHEFSSALHQSFFSQARYELPSQGSQPVMRVNSVTGFRGWQRAPSMWYADNRRHPALMRCSVSQLTDQCVYTTLCMSVWAAHASQPLSVTNPLLAQW